MIRIYNCYGDDITGLQIRFSDPSNGTYNENGDPVPNWPPENKDVDRQGFDKHHKEPNGFYKQEVVLPKGTMICRYGPSQGRTTTNVGVPYELLSLPFDKRTLAYREYEVIADGVLVECMVVRGKVYPAFGSLGGVVQYVHPYVIDEEVYLGKLKEDMSWLENKKMSVSLP